MKINRETLLACPTETAADLLYEQGKSLRGSNLKKSSWLVIAGGLHVQRISDILLNRLTAAATRQDALRVLRIARKWARPGKASGSARRQAPKENLRAVVDETSPAMYAQDEDDLRWELMIDEEIWPQGNYEEWLAEQANTNLSRRSRQPGLQPTSTLQNAINRYAWDRQPAPGCFREDVRSHLDEETYRRLLTLANRKPGLDLSEAELNYFREHDLEPLLRFAANPVQSFRPAPLRDGFAVAGLRILEDQLGSQSHPFAVDWEAIEPWLAERLAHEPQPGMFSTLIACAYDFFRSAPAPLLARLLQSSSLWRQGWASLLGYAYQRASDLFPEKALPTAEPRGWWGLSGAYVNDTPWERILDAGTGSHLVLNNLKNNLADLTCQPALLKNRYWNGARKLLMAGGGSLRRMDYPAFRLVCRPSITLVRLETFTQLTRLAAELCALHAQVTALSRSSLAEWVARTFETLSPNPLPGDLCLRIAGTLERHAIAYLMLKERVLRDAFFRLRRRHIQRFWTDCENGKIPFPIPADFAALRAEFGVEGVKEALVNALLDHFKDDWGAPQDAAQPLKESLLILLRSVTITYHLQAPRLPRFGEQPSEDDLGHTQEMANFLIQQVEQAPLELAQALWIDPQQGLPRLAGGQLTALERNCRRLVKETAGASPKKVVEGETRIFSLRPLTKSEALDRGNLGGDCSSGSVPLRALSPHHTYYGVYENGVQQRGYITVYEALARIEEEAGTGEQRPMLCLETINVPLRVFDAVQQDLLVLFEAVARSRGLTDGLVLITGLGTWNYQNGEVLRQSRRFRQGRAVRLFPADPASWNVYRLLAPEAERYTAFFDDEDAQQYKGYFRILAPFEPDLDPVEPENLAEAQRIAALPPKRLWITARSETGPAGFISEPPDTLF